MNAAPYAVAALIVGAVFFSPTTAHADAPPLEPWTATTEGTPWVDCDAAMWYVEVTHYTAEQIEPGVYAEATTTTSVEEWGPATGDSADSDCPNWVIANPEDEPVWVNTGEKFPPALPLDPLPTEAELEPGDLGKAGIVSPPKVGLSLTS